MGILVDGGAGENVCVGNGGDNGCCKSIIPYTFAIRYICDKHNMTAIKPAGYIREES